MPIPTPAISEAFLEIALLAERRGVVPISAIPGCWEAAAGDWWFAFNGHPEAQKCSQRDITVEPYTAYIEFNGYPAGVIDPFGGWLISSAAVNEAALIDALRSVR